MHVAHEEQSLAAGNPPDASIETPAYEMNRQIHKPGLFVSLFRRTRGLSWSAPLLDALIRVRTRRPRLFTNKTCTTVKSVLVASVGKIGGCRQSNYFGGSRSECIFPVERLRESRGRSGLKSYRRPRMIIFGSEHSVFVFTTNTRALFLR